MVQYISRLFLLFLIIMVSGCAVIDLPKYITNENAYQKNFYGDFQEVLKAAMDALDDIGWMAVETSDPGIYEHDTAILTENSRQILVFTEVKTRFYGIAKSYRRINIYLQNSVNNTVSVEIRYLKTTSLPFKTFYNYKNESLAQKIFKQMDANLNKG